MKKEDQQNLLVKECEKVLPLD